MRDQYNDREPLTFRNPRKNLFCTVQLHLSRSFQTKQLDFTRRREDARCAANFEEFATAARSGNATTLLTLHERSRHAASAPLPALRHLSNAHKGSVCAG